MPRYTNDGTGEAPKLRVYLNLDNLADLRPGSRWCGATGVEALRRLKEDGFAGAQFTGPGEPPAERPLPLCGCDRISTPDEANAVVGRHAARGYTCLTIHAGWGIEDDAEMDRIVDAMLTASERHRLPVFLETHRATITQDMWRTVQLVRRFPELRFNGDFSHYYTGQEMVYGGLEMKMAFMAPIFDRVGFLHGRIGSPGCIQVPVDDGTGRPAQAHGTVDYLEDFRKIWTRAMRGFVRNASAGDYLIFAPELLSGLYYYARLIPDAQGRLVEETDRYAQALVLKRLAERCFADAQA